MIHSQYFIGPVENRATSLGTQAAIQRRRRPKRRSTGVVFLDSDVCIINFFVCYLILYFLICTVKSIKLIKSIFRLNI